MKYMLCLEGVHSSSECIHTLEFNALSRGVGMLESSGYVCVAMWRTVFSGQDVSSKSILRNRGLKIRCYEKTIV
jgi:hypothetical protein